MTCKAGRPALYSNAELALAYELRQEGCSWKAIARGIGGCDGTLKKAIRRAERYGLRWVR